MREEDWRKNKVYYKYLDKNKKIIIDKSEGSACYANFQSNNFKNDGIFVLKNFHKSETVVYIKKYLIQLSKIFKCNIVYINDDEIEVTNFKNYYHLKIFGVMFRYLFENITTKGDDNIKLLKLFTEDKRNKDVLWKFIDNFNTVKFNMGSTNHCISKNWQEPLLLKTTKDLHNHTWKNYSPIHDFFNKK